MYFGTSLGFSIFNIFQKIKRISKKTINLTFHKIFAYLKEEYRGLFRVRTISVVIILHIFYAVICWFVEQNAPSLS